MSEKKSNLPNSINTLIGPKMSVEGDISCGGVLRVQGELHGNVSCNATAEGALVVDGEGQVNGSVHARHIAVRGRVVGPLQSAQSIEIHQGGSVAGNILYKELAIHAGGVFEGILKPLRLTDGDDAAPAPSALLQGAGSRRRSMRVAIVVAVSAVAALAGGWLWRNLPVADHPTESVALKADTSLRNSGPSEKPREERKESPGGALSKAESEPPAVMEAIPASYRSDADQAKVETVRGINPSRPTGVFLLVANEPIVLYRKKRDEPGDGARVTVAEGERASVSIAADEVIRIAKGADVTMFYQGQKVPRQAIESGSWISFVPR